MQADALWKVGMAFAGVRCGDRIGARRVGHGGATCAHGVTGAATMIGGRDLLMFGGIVRRRWSVDGGTKP